MMEDKANAVLEEAKRLYAEEADWAKFVYRLLGKQGVVRTTFTDPVELAAFQQTEAYAEIQRMVAQLRKQNGDGSTASKDCKVITVRLPESMLEYLKDEADIVGTSVNRLCISKLLQFIDTELVPPSTVPSKKRGSAQPAHTQETECTATD
ncbi:MAG: hypothetical protein K6T86_01970 [Pirellulales bacterium]|jgi:uncharacterized protein (DUF1778 family)|nr:hypothetical protein [Pirellulales bacterium]